MEFQGRLCANKLYALACPQQLEKLSTFGPGYILAFQFAKESGWGAEPKEYRRSQHTLAMI